MKKPGRRKRTPARRPRRDPLIEDVRRIRAKIYGEHGNDLDRLFEHLRQVEESYGGKVVHKRGKRSTA
jgi:hypothetical protein